MAKNKNGLNLPTFRINDELRGNYDVRITGEGVETRVLPLTEAKKVAESMEMDLIEINAYAKPPIVRVASYEKMIYNMKKAAKEKKKNAAKPMKEVQLSVNISEHDLQTKANNAKRFIDDGSKVKVILSMRGRELSRRDENKKSLLDFIVMMEDVAMPETMPRDEGNRTTVILKGKK